MILNVNCIYGTTYTYEQHEQFQSIYGYQTVCDNEIAIKNNCSTDCILRRTDKHRKKYCKYQSKIKE